MVGVAGGRKTYAPRPSPRHGSRDIALSIGQQYVHGDVLITPRRKKRRKVFWKATQLGMALIVALSFASTLYAVLLMPNLNTEHLGEASGSGSWAKMRSLVNQERLVERIGFGSGTGVASGPQPVWTRGVIPSAPDVWIWGGDMAYLDAPSVDCKEHPIHPHCSCAPDWLHEPPLSCMTGNVSHAKVRMRTQIANPDYGKFLEYMCPGQREKGVAPPLGMDPKTCPRKMMGTYDDHDYGWQGGDGRLPAKDALKNVYLDGIGEGQNSVRRSPGRGIETKVTLNSGRNGQEIDVLLLDERYYRDPLPCQMRKEFCEKGVLHNTSHPKHAWCYDFLKRVGKGDAGGSCCKKDSKLFYGWCKDKKNRSDALWATACDPSSPYFGVKPLFANRRGQIGEREKGAESQFCEVLGVEQRRWLEGALHSSRSPLKIIVSSSPLLANPKPVPCWGPIPNITGGGECICSGDDWECFKPAQLHLLHMAARAPGCTVIIAGDLGYSDIKVVRPGQQAYAEHYESKGLGKAIYQVMASGLTAVPGQDQSCTGGEGWTGDPVGTRENLQCDFALGPSFGMIEIDWAQLNPVVKLQIRDGNSDQVKLESQFSLSECLAAPKAIL